MNQNVFKLTVEKGGWEKAKEKGEGMGKETGMRKSGQEGRGEGQTHPNQKI